MEDLYEQIIIDHYRHPLGRGLREPFDAEVMHVNPTCGDEITLRVTLDPLGGGARPAAVGAAEGLPGDAASGGGVAAGAAGGPGDAIVADISYENQGCAISQGSASVMYDLLVGKSVVDALVVYEQFRSMMHREGIADEDALGDAVAFAGVAKYSARVKCALLAWTAWKDATARALAQGER